MMLTIRIIFKTAIQNPLHFLPNIDRKFLEGVTINIGSSLHKLA